MDLGGSVVQFVFCEALLVSIAVAIGNSNDISAVLSDNKMIFAVCICGNNLRRLTVERINDLSDLCFPIFQCYGIAYILVP